MSPQAGVFKKLLSISPFSPYFFKKWLKYVIFDKTSSGGNKRWYYQNNKPNSHWQDMCEKKCYLLFLLKFVSSCCFDLLKKEHISNFNDFFLKKIPKFILKHYFLLHLICYIAHRWFIWTTLNLFFRIYFFIAPRRSQKITIIFFTSVTGVKHTYWCLLRPWYR